MRLTFFLTLFSPILLFSQTRDTIVPVFSVNVYFDSDQHHLDSSATRELKYLSNLGLQMDTFIVKVNAHTDEIGSASYNMELSKKRASEIERYLVSKNIPPHQISTTYSGEELIAIPLEHAKNRRGEIVLYQPMKLIQVRGRVVDEETKEGINATVTINDWIYKKTTKTDSYGRFEIPAPLGSRASISVSSPDYFMEGNMINIHRDIDKKPLTIPLPRIALDRVYSFKNLNFEGNKAVLLPHSYLPVKQLSTFLANDLDLCIEVEGHINLPNQDSAGIETFHYDLSVARALKIKNELVTSGTESSRILARGYANWRMKYPKAFSPRQQAANRRVTIAIRNCEVVASTSDDRLENLEKYDHDWLDWKYDPSQISKILEVNTAAKIALFAGVLRVNQRGEKPRNYTFRELFRIGVE